MLLSLCVFVATAAPILVTPKPDPEPKPPVDVVEVESAPTPTPTPTIAPVVPVEPAPFTTPVPAKAKLEQRFKQRRLVQAQRVGEGTPLVLVVEPTSSIVALTRRGPAPFEFEPGKPMRTAWPADPWLVRDLNKNGKVDSGRELFGSFTMLKSGKLAKNGFEALAELDDNGDKVIDERDAAFASLLLWYSGRGYSTWTPLGDDVEALELSHWIDERCDELGNCVRERSRAKLRPHIEGAPVEGALVDLHLVMVPFP